MGPSEWDEDRWSSKVAVVLSMFRIPDPAPEALRRVSAWSRRLLAATAAAAAVIL